MLDRIRGVPQAIVLYHTASLSKLLPFTKNQTARQGQATVYVCRNRVCRYPVTELRALDSIL